MEKIDKKIVLEVERPETEEARRRVIFWEKLGFKLNEHHYIQPPYDDWKEPVKMFIMSSPKEIDYIDFSLIRQIIHTQVYGLEKPIL